MWLGYGLVWFGMVWYGWGMVSCIRAGAFHQSRLIIQDWSTPAAARPQAIESGNRQEPKKLEMGKGVVGAQCGWDEVRIVGCSHGGMTLFC